MYKALFINLLLLSVVALNSVAQVEYSDNVVIRHSILLKDVTHFVFLFFFKMVNFVLWKNF